MELEAVTRFRWPTRNPAWQEWMDKESHRVWLAAVGMFVCAVAVAIVYAYYRGPWIDEFYQLWVSDPNETIQQNFRRWSDDTHTPIYGMAARVLAEVLPRHDFFIYRLTNAIPLFALLGVWLFLWWQWPAQRLFLGVFLVLFVSSGFFRIQFADFRVYFSILCTGAILVLTAYYVLCHPARQRWGDLVARGMMMFSLALLVTLHHFATLWGIILAVAVALVFIFEKRWFDLWVLAIGCVLGCLVFGGWALFQISRWEKLGSIGWIRTDALDGFLVAGRVALYGSGFNLVVLATALVVLARERTARRTVPRKSAGNSDDLAPTRLCRETRGALVIGGAALAFFAVVVVFNIFQPTAIERYWSCASVGVMLCLAALAGEIRSRRGLVFTLVATNAAVFSAGRLASDLTPGAFDRWNTTSEAIVRHLDEHPDTPVYMGVFTEWNGPVATAPVPGFVYDLAYKHMAREYGFTANLEYLPTSLDAAAGDRAIIWTEQFREADFEGVTDPVAFAQKIGLRLPEVWLSNLSLERSPKGAVLIHDPDIEVSG